MKWYRRRTQADNKDEVVPPLHASRQQRKSGATAAHKQTTKIKWCRRCTKADNKDEVVPPLHASRQQR